MARACSRARSKSLPKPQYPPTTACSGAGHRYEKHMPKKTLCKVLAGTIAAKGEELVEQKT